MYLLLAAIVLLLLFAASYGGRSTWVALASSSLSVLIVAGCAFIANAGSAGPYFNALAAQTPTLLQAGVQDLAFAAERTAASLAQTRENTATVTITPPPVAAAPDESSEDGADWLDLSWPDPLGWLTAAAQWLDPSHWSDAQETGKPSMDSKAGSDAGTQNAGTQLAETQDAVASEPDARTPQSPMPTVRAMMQPRDGAATTRASTAPSYRIVTAPPVQNGPVSALLPNSPGAPVKWLSAASLPAGLEGALLTGTNTSSAPLEDIQARLKPDSAATTLGIENIALGLRVEGPDGTAQPGTSIPPGARFHLQAMDLSEEDAKRLGGAIMSFSYSQDGRRRTSIMYLKQAALNGAPAGPQ